MHFTKFQFNTHCYWPSSPKKIVEFIGGSYLATRPDFAYKRFIENKMRSLYGFTSVPIKIYFRKK